jgi:putative transposase
MDTYKEINKAVKVRLYPTKEQKLVFEENINHARFVFNKVKESCEYHYKIIKEQGIKPRNLTSNKFCNIILTQLKQSHDFLYDSDSTSLQASYQNYINAMKNFFNRVAKYPRFKSKRNPIQSFRVKNSMDRLRINDNRLKIGKHGFVKVRGLRNITGKILSITISKIGSKWFASIN